MGDDSPQEWCCDRRGTAAKASHRRDEYSYGRLASLVGVRRDPIDPGVVAVADRPRLVNAAAARGDTVARSGRLLGGTHRFTHLRRPHRITPSPQPLRMALARVRVWPRPSASRGVLRRLRACGEAGIAGGSPDDLPPAGAGGAGVAYPRALPLAAVPNWAAAVATLAFLGLDRDHVGDGATVPRSFLR